jgi:hypothetical protein
VVAIGDDDNVYSWRFGMATTDKNVTSNIPSLKALKLKTTLKVITTALASTLGDRCL